MAVDHDKELDLEDLSIDLEEVGSEQPRDEVVAEDDLEQYGVWVKVKPHAFAEAAEPGQKEPRLESLTQEPASTAGEGLTEEEEQLLGSLEEGGPPEPPALDDLGELPIPEEEDVGALEPEDQVEVPLSDEPAAREGFDDLSSLEEELDATAPTRASIVAGPRTQVLEKIEEELAAIRGELAALKSELVNLRRPAAEIEVKPAEAEREAGFFADDSDETIALTGDELDNILNTAEITEEEASDEAVGDDLGDMTVLAEPEAGGETLPLEEPVMEMPAFEALDETPALGSQEVSLELPEEASVELELPDVDEIGLDTLEGPSAAMGMEPLAEEAEPLEELEIELTEEAPQDAAVPDADLAQLEEAAPAMELAGLSEELEIAPGGEEESLLDVPEEVGADLESLETAEMEKPAAAGPMEAEEEISLDLPEIELPAEEEEAEASTEGLSLEIPEDEIAEAAGAASGLAGAEPLEEAEAIEEIGPGDRPSEEVEGPAPKTAAKPAAAGSAIPSGLRDEIRLVLKYMDQLLEALPDDKIEEFARSEYFEVYKRLFEELEIA